MMQRVLFEETDDVDVLDIGKSVRNANYSMIKPYLPEKRRCVYEVILQYPDGICNKKIASALGWPINCVTGRVSELHQLGLVQSDGVDYLPDHNGRMHPNTLWRAV